MSVFNAILKRLSSDDEAKLIESRVTANAASLIEDVVRRLNLIDFSAFDEFASAQRSLSAIIDDLNKLQCGCQIRSMQIRQDLLDEKYDTLFFTRGDK